MPEESKPSLDEAQPPAPKTWREYFEQRLAAEGHRSEASDRLSEAGQAYRAANQRVVDLEAWAKATNKAKPYSGSHMDNEPIPAGAAKAGRS